MTDCGVEDKLPELKKWYDGYRFGNSEIYNPWSVVQFVDNGCKFRPYWLNTSGNSILNTLLEHVDEELRKQLGSMMRFDDTAIRALVDEGITYQNIKDDRNALYMMLLTTGYLILVKEWQDTRGRWWCFLQIPNREVLIAYEDEILAKVAGEGNRLRLFDMLDAMTAGNADSFQKIFSELLREVVSFHDTAQPESFYHGLVLGFAVLTEETYRVESNRESGYGRFDIAFFPKRVGVPGVVLEIKKAESEDEMEKKAKEALKQIDDKAYLRNYPKITYTFCLPKFP